MSNLQQHTARHDLSVSPSLSLSLSPLSISISNHNALTSELIDAPPCVSSLVKSFVLYALEDFPVDLLHWATTWIVMAPFFWTYDFDPLEDDALDGTVK